MCDLKAIQIILSFAIGGITLRGIIALVKGWLGWEGVKAVGLAFALCAIASAIYLVATHTFSLACLFVISFGVFSGSQVTFQLTKKKA